MADQFGEAFVSIRAKLDKLDDDLQDARKKIEDFTKKTGKTSGFDIGISSAITSKSMEILQSGMRLAVDTMTDGVSKAADLEAQLDAIGAISGATDAQVAGLKKTVSDLGLDPNLKVSAFEAARAVEELVAGGVSIEDVMSGAARGTVALSNATGGDFALSAAIAADSMSIFNIEASDMEQVIDGVSAVAVQSKFDVNDYALALAQAGGIAATSGVEFDDFNTTIASIAPLFASGSDAGTSFKVMLQRLIPGSKEAAGVMQELGIITEEEGNRFFDAQGNLKDMAEVAGILDEAFSGLSEAQRNSAMQTIFGTDAMRAAVGLMSQGSEGFTQMQQAISQTSGMDAAAQRMTNLSGQTEILKGVVEGLQIQYGDMLIPKLTEMAQKATEFSSTQGPALVESLANLTLGAIDFGERAGPALSQGLSTVTGLGDAVGKLAQASQDVAEAFGLVSENAETFDPILFALNALVTASMAPFEGLTTIIDAMAMALEGTAMAVKNLVDWVGSLGSGLSGLDGSLPDWLRPGSPPPLQIALEGISGALNNMPDFASSFGLNTPSFPALAGAGVSNSNTSVVNIDGVSATRVNQGNPADEAIRMTVQILRSKLKATR